MSGAMRFSGVAENIFGLTLSLGFPPAILFGLLALLGLFWSPFAAVICARRAREMGLDPLLFARKGFAYSILFLFPWFYLRERMSGAEVSRRVAIFIYAILYYVWVVAGIFLSAAYVGVEVERVVINPAHVGDRGDLGALLWLLPAPIINVILCVASLRCRICRDRCDRQHSGRMPTVPTGASMNREGSAAEIIPDRAYTNPFGFSLIGTIITLVLFIIYVAVRFSS